LKSRRRPKKRSRLSSRQAKRKGGLGEGIFARLLSAPKARKGWEAARSCLSRKTKPAKIDSLKKVFCGRPLKEKEIFAGFVRHQAASRWGGFLPVRAEIIAQKRFELRSVIATRFKISNFTKTLSEAIKPLTTLIRIKLKNPLHYRTNPNLLY